MRTGSDGAKKVGLEIGGLRCRAAFTAETLPLRL